MFLKLLGKLLTYSLISILGVVAFCLSVDNYQAGYLVNVLENKNFQANFLQIQPAMAESQSPENLYHPPLPIRDLACPEPEISAVSAISVEKDKVHGDRILFSKEEGKVLPIASLTKLMTALIVLESYNLDEISTVTQDAVSQQGLHGSLSAGDQLSVRNLLYIMLIESSNDAAYALAEIKGVDNFIALMNGRANSLGLSNTHFADANGLAAENYSTAGDLAKFAEYLLENHGTIWQILLLDKYNLYTPQGTFHHELSNTDELLGKIPGIIGGKTGQTLQAGGCLIIIIKNSKTQNNIINVVLGSKDKFGDMEELIDWINKAHTW